MTCGGAAASPSTCAGESCGTALLAAAYMEGLRQLLDQHCESATAAAAAPSSAD
jgi:hypothetical protein